MLCTSKRVAERHGKHQKVAVGGSTQLFCILENHHDCAPALKHKSPVNLLQPQDWLAAAKKFRLSNKSLSKLKAFWAVGGSEFVSGSLREKWGFQFLEDLMVRRMKRLYLRRRGQAELVPFHDWAPGNQSVNNHLIAANSSAGKTFFANKLLTTLDENGKNYAQNRPIVAFTSHSSDPSLAEARKRYKTQWTDVDLTKVDMNIADISILEPGTLAIFDDAIDTKDHTAKALFALLNKIVTVGRHHKSARGRGTEAIIITHRGGCRELGLIRQACRWWTLFPNQKTQAVHLLKTRLNMTKAQIGRLLARCGDSRTVTFDMWYPQKCLSTRHCELID